MKLEDWYGITRKQAEETGGVDFKYIVNKYSTLYRLLKAAFPEFRWEAEKFTGYSPRIWDSLDDQQGFVAGIGRKLGVSKVCIHLQTSPLLRFLTNHKKLDDWYSVRRGEVEGAGGLRLFTRYSSLANALRAIYPDHPWDSSKFASDRVPVGYWKDRDHVFQALTRAEEKIGMTKVFIHYMFLFIFFNNNLFSMS